MVLHESGENYLETIWLLEQRNGFVRSVDIAGELGFSKASISRAMGILRDKGYVQMGSGSRIQLTQKGESRAREIYERHQVIARFLRDVLKVDEETADADACRIEHVISKTSFEKISQMVRGSEEANAEG